MKLLRLLAAAFALLPGFHGKTYAQGSADVIAEFIRNNPGKSAIYLVRNGEVLVDLNADKKMPLASTMKIIIAIEYAAQAASGKIDPAMPVDSAELDKYYIPNTDGGAHEVWLDYLHKRTRINKGKTTLEEVANGMIVFSSNANTEYLLDLLGPENVNKRLELLGLQQHDKIYYLVGALCVINGKNAVDLENMPWEEYVAQAKAAHEKLKSEPGYKSTVTDLPLDAQKVWSDRLPAATAKDYVSVLQAINNRTLGEATHKYLSPVLETLMNNPANKQWLKHAGMKGGSTLWVLTKAVCATTTSDETTEMAYFFNGLKMQDVDNLAMHMNSFELAILTNRDGARERILKILQGQQ